MDDHETFPHSGRLTIVFLACRVYNPIQKGGPWLAWWPMMPKTVATVPVCCVSRRAMCEVGKLMAFCGEDEGVEQSMKMQLTDPLYTQQQQTADCVNKNDKRQLCVIIINILLGLLWKLAQCPPRQVFHISKPCFFLCR